MWESEKLDLVKNDSTGVWKEVKSWLGWGTSGTPTQLFWEGRLITSPLDLANSMNRFFLQKIQILRNSIPDNNEDPMSKLREAMRGRQCEFSIKKVCQSDVLKMIKGLIGHRLYRYKIFEAGE